MENFTYNSVLIQLEGLNLMKDLVNLAFFFILISYNVHLILHFGILALIIVDKKLHQPMYILFCNLSINDILASSDVLPRLLSDILHPPSERFIYYYECVIQAFIIHLVSTASHTILMIMAFDRYVAICHPLRYSAIMTNRMVVKLTAFAWGAPLVTVAILLGLTIRLNRCRTRISGAYCANVSLFMLSCESSKINNIYGLTFTTVLFVSSLGSILTTYTRIAMVCLISKNKSLNSKALKTCSTHLLVYLIMILCGLMIITLHRFPQYAEFRKIAAVVLIIVPGGLNPIIYGLQSKEIRRFLSKVFSSRKFLCARFC